MGVYLTNRGRVALRGRGGVEGDTEAFEAKLGACRRGLGSYNRTRAVRPVNAPTMMAVIRFSSKYL